MSWRREREREREHGHLWAPTLSHNIHLQCFISIFLTGFFFFFFYPCAYILMCSPRVALSLPPSPFTWLHLLCRIPSGTVWSWVPELRKWGSHFPTLMVVLFTFHASLSLWILSHLDQSAGTSNIVIAGLSGYQNSETQPVVFFFSPFKSTTSTECLCRRVAHVSLHDSGKYKNIKHGPCSHDSLFVCVPLHTELRLLPWSQTSARWVTRYCLAARLRKQSHKHDNGVRDL